MKYLPGKLNDFLIILLVTCQMDLMAPVFKIVKDTLNDFKGLRDIYIVKTDDIASPLHTI